MELRCAQTHSKHAHSLADLATDPAQQPPHALPTFWHHSRTPPPPRGFPGIILCGMLLGTCTAGGGDLKPAGDGAVGGNVPCPCETLFDLVLQCEAVS